MNAPLSLKTRISDDWKAAMKAGERARKEALSLLLAAIKQKQVDSAHFSTMRADLDDAAVLATIEKMLKQRKDSVTQYEAAGRQELADAEKFEIEVLSAYMPQALSGEEIDALIDAAMSQSGAKAPNDMGRVIALLKPQLAGRADMADVSRRVKSRLSPA